MKRDDFKEIKKKFLKEQKINSYDLFIEGKPNIDAIEVALRKAYNDAQPRLIPNHKDIVIDLWKDDEEYPMGYLNKQIQIFFNNKIGQDDKRFEEWYQGTYEVFLSNYKGIMDNKIDKSVIENQGIGKAQKIINMSLKYLYCMAEGEEQEKLFIMCHMPLDHYTLENWFCRKIDEINKIDKYKDKPFEKEQLKAWSKISDYDLYKKVQDAIGECITGPKYIIDNDVMTPLQAEFIIWEEEKIREVLLGVINLDAGDKKKYYDADLQDIISKACEVVKELNGEK